jgi:hypothetical protein
MMNMRMKTLAISGLLLLSACATRQKVLDVAAVSMTKSYIHPGETLKEVGPVTGKFCSDSWKDKGSVGLFDESVKAAQNQAGVDYILNASFWHEGNCVTVEGTGAKVAGGAVPAALEAPKVPADAPASAPAKKTKKK